VPTPDAGCCWGRRPSIRHVQYLVRRRRCRIKTKTYSESRAHFAETLNSVIDDREEVIVTRAGHDPVVIVALDDYESLRETAYLLRTPANARRLLGAIYRLESGEGVQQELDEA
jgi:antitoxin YefM